VLAKLLATCGTGNLRDIRDHAILMVAFASGGRLSQRDCQSPQGAVDGRGPDPDRRRLSPPVAGHPSWSDQEASAVNAIVKQRAEMAGLEPADYSAHGLRSGYLTEAANRGIPCPRRWSSRAIDPSSRQ
jgi:hypothetical protein